MKKTANKTSRLLVGAALAGLMVGSAAPLASCSGDKAAAKGHNGCNGPNGCGSTGTKKEANGCGGANGCKGGHDAKKEANSCGGANGCKAGQDTKKK